MHGFLNLFFATAFAGKRHVAELCEIIDDTDPARFRFADDGLRYGKDALGAHAIEEARRHFVGYGSCSFSEPVDDLIELAILPKA